MNDPAPPPLTLLRDELAWWPALATAHRAADVGAWAEVVRTLTRAGYADAWVALADAAIHGADVAWQRAEEAPGARAAVVHDLATVIHVLLHDSEGEGPSGLPAARALAPEPEGHVASVAADLRAAARASEKPSREAAEGLAERLAATALRFRSESGGGPLGRAIAFRWDGTTLEPIARPAAPSLDALTGLDRQVERLRANVRAFLDGRPAMHALAYGPRGSGKSTVVRGLLDAYAHDGLRLIEVPAARLADLPRVAAAVRGRPERFLVFVDDLAFEAGDARYQALKSLLEGSVDAGRPALRLVATSNRRHLVQERLRDRPDPVEDDVHAWDTHNERLALADRFGLVVQFPSADRRRYLEIVAHLAGRDGVDAPDLPERADRFARHGNGYSGRTARQFVDAVRAGLA